MRNPATGDVIAQIPTIASDDDVDRAMKSAARRLRGQGVGRHGHRTRARLVNRLADVFEANLEELYRLETTEQRPPAQRDAGAAVAPAGFLPLFRRAWRSPRRDAVIPVEGSYLNYTLRTPIGIVANCTPFNHPLMIMCKIAGRGAGDAAASPWSSRRNTRR